MKNNLQHLNWAYNSHILFSAIQHFSCSIHKFTCGHVQKVYTGSWKRVVGDGKGKRGEGNRGGCWVNSGLQTPTLIQYVVSKAQWRIITELYFSVFHTVYSHSLARDRVWTWKAVCSQIHTHNVAPPHPNYTHSKIHLMRHLNLWQEWVGWECCLVISNEQDKETLFNQSIIIETSFMTPLSKDQRKRDELKVG